MVFEYFPNLALSGKFGQRNGNLKKDCSPSIILSAEVIPFDLSYPWSFGLLPKDRSSSSFPPLLKSAVKDIAEISIDPRQSLVFGTGVPRGRGLANQPIVLTES
jgi:hypothetical protein